MQSVNILGVEFSNRTLNETIELIDKQLESQREAPFHVITANPEIVMQLNRDEEFKVIQSKAGLVTADGVGILFGARILGKRIKERVTGIELLTELLKVSEKKAYSVFLLGANEETSIKFEALLNRDYPALRIAGRRNGYFDNNEVERIIEEINEGKTDLLVMAMGSPRSHKWFDKHREKLDVKVVIGVGGSFDTLTGKVKRAPILIRKLNLEWLYRRLKEPSRAERQKDLFRFIKEVFKKRLSSI